MQSLFSANLAYLALLGGIFLGVMAFITPGTGLLELGTFGLLGLAGYGMVRYGVNGWALLVLGLSFIPLYYAVRQAKRYGLLALATLGIAVGAAFLFPGGKTAASVSPWMALAGAVIFSLLTWFFIREMLTADTLPAENAPERLVGMIGEAKSDIGQEGSVQVGGQLWSARSHHPIAAGQSVRVTGMEGLILLVEPLEKSASSDAE